MRHQGNRGCPERRSLRPREPGVHLQESREHHEWTGHGFEPVSLPIRVETRRERHSCDGQDHERGRAENQDRGLDHSPAEPLRRDDADRQTERTEGQTAEAAEDEEGVHQERTGREREPLHPEAAPVVEQQRRRQERRRCEGGRIDEDDLLLCPTRQQEPPTRRTDPVTMPQRATRRSIGHRRVPPAGHESANTIGT